MNSRYEVGIHWFRPTTFKSVQQFFTFFQNIFKQLNIKHLTNQQHITSQIQGEALDQSSLVSFNSLL